MWSRKLSASLGMDQEEFVGAFTKALKTETVQRCLKEAICEDILKEVRDLTEIVKRKDKRINDLEVKVRELEAKNDELEQYSRRNSLRISGIPEDPFEDVSEKTLELIKTDLGKKDFTISAIDRVHRVGTKTNGAQPRSILVKFATYRERAAVYKRRSSLKDRVGASIYINEDLTKSRATLLYKARKAKKDKTILDCWTADGNILVKDWRGRVANIRHEEDLQRVAMEKPTPEDTEEDAEETAVADYKWPAQPEFSESTSEETC